MKKIARAETSCFEKTFFARSLQGQKCSDEKIEKRKKKARKSKKKGRKSQNNALLCLPGGCLSLLFHSHLSHYSMSLKFSLIYFFFVYFFLNLIFKTKRKIKIQYVNWYISQKDILYLFVFNFSLNLIVTKLHVKRVLKGHPVF